MTTSRTEGRLASQPSTDSANLEAERQPLLSGSDAEDQDYRQPIKETPLPKRKIAILVIARFAEPINFSMIFPFINEMVFDLGATDDKAKVGFYAGLIESLFSVAQTCTILFWGSLSDRIGRKPVLLTGLTGVACSAILFGLSRNFVWAVSARVLTGVTNGNVAITKSMMGEITDSTNQARAFSFLPLVWTVGCFFGPLLGGYLSKPVQQYPGVFGEGGPLYMGGFWETFPYLLPCLVSAMITLTSITLASLFLEETLPKIVEAKERKRIEQEAERQALVPSNQAPSLSPIPARSETIANGSAFSRHSAAAISDYGATSDFSVTAAKGTSNTRPPVRRGRSRASSSAIRVQSWASGFTPTDSPAHSREASPERRAQQQQQQEQLANHVTQRISGAAEDPKKSAGVFELLRIPQIQSVLLSYAFLSLVAVALDAVLVLYLYEPIPLGGLGFSSDSTGVLLSLTGLGGAAVQLLLFPPLQRKIGTLRVYQLSMWAFPVAVLLMPAANLLARAGLRDDGTSQQQKMLERGDSSDDISRFYLVLVWTCILASTLVKVLGTMAFSSNNILVNQCASLTKGTALGTLNSLAQMSASIMRAIGPYAANTLFAVSVTQKLLGGQFVWLILALTGIVGSLVCLLVRDMDQRQMQAERVERS